MLSTEADVKTSPPQKIPAESYLPQLDGLRALGMLFVFIVHAWQHPKQVATGIACFAALSVDAFFVLSAFLITSLLISERAQYGNISYRLFFMRRCLRIWPLYFSVLFFGCILLPLASFQNVGLNAWAQYPQFLVQQFLPLLVFLGNFTFIFNRDSLLAFSQAINIPIQGLLFPLWTMCIEEQFYIVWPLIMRKVKNIATLVAVLCGLEAISVASRLWFHALSTQATNVPLPPHLYYLNTICHLDPLLTGCLIAIAYHLKPSIFRCGTALGAIMLGLLSAAIVYLFLNFEQHLIHNSVWTVADMTVSALTCGIFIFLLLSWEPVKKLFSNPVMANVGRLTFAMYVFHNFVLELITKVLEPLPIYGHPEASFLVKFVIGFPITYGLACLSWRVLEGPCHRLKSRYSRRKDVKTNVLANAGV